MNLLLKLVLCTEDKYTDAIWVLALAARNAKSGPVVVPVAEKKDSSGRLMLDGNVPLGNITCVSKAKYSISKDVCQRIYCNQAKGVTSGLPVFCHLIESLVFAFPEEGGHSECQFRKPCAGKCRRTKMTCRLSKLSSDIKYAKIVVYFR